MTEREFALNNINKYEGVFSKEELNVHLKYVKDLYKIICENTSEEKDTREESINLYVIKDLKGYINIQCDKFANNNDQYNANLYRQAYRFFEWFEAQKRKVGKQ